jgi:acyl-CoA thioesterase FadM
MVLGPRFVWAQLCAILGRKVPIQGPVTRRFLVLPFIDCETGVSLNASRYLYFSDLVSLECNTRSGFTWAGLKRGMWAITLSNTIFYRRPIRAFSRIAVTSELIGWDERFWVWQNTYRNSRGQLCAVGFAKVAGMSKKGLEPTSRGFQVVQQPAFARVLKTDIAALFSRLEEVAKRVLEEG